jgi:hypothetical protein
MEKGAEEASRAEAGGREGCAIVGVGLFHFVDLRKRLSCECPGAFSIFENESEVRYREWKRWLFESSLVADLGLRVAVNAKNFRCAGLVPVGEVQNAFDEALFEFTNGFVEQDPALHHLVDEPFQLIFHDDTLR